MKSIDGTRNHNLASVFMEEDEQQFFHTIFIHIPAHLVKQIYHEAMNAQQRHIHPHGMHNKEASLLYIEHMYHEHILEQVHEFLVRFLVLDILYKELRKKRLILAEEPHLNKVIVDENENSIFHFSAVLFPNIELYEWKYLPFKTPRRKRYRDLDRQVIAFATEEEKNKQDYQEEIELYDWLNIDVALIDDDHNELIEGHRAHLWLRIGNEESDISLQELFVGKHRTDILHSQNEHLQDFFNPNYGNNFNFKITVHDIIPSKYVCMERIKKQFRLKTNKELHQKLVEIFSYRNDISQRTAIISEMHRLLMSKNFFDIPTLLVHRRQEELLKTMQSNPDYLVYKSQPNFKKTLHNLAERQLKELILMDQIAFNEQLEATHEDVAQYLNLIKRSRTREFIHFRMPTSKINEHATPIVTQELALTCLREKTLNHIIFHLTKK